MMCITCCIPGFHMLGAVRSQTLADCIMLRMGGGGGDVRLCRCIVFTGLGLQLSLVVSTEGGLRRVASCARIASWYLRYLSCVNYDTLE